MSCFLTFTGLAGAEEHLFTFEEHTALALRDAVAASHDLGADLLDDLPVGTLRSDVIENLEHLKAITSIRENREGRDVGGDTNIRDCRSTSPQTLDCVWFLFVPEPLREDALAEGIYGVTWIMHFGFDGNDRLQNIGIELLIERL
ncbi:MAG: hypothetical protein P8Q36_03065 [Alphaproteobacteria bacterium]|nr:hypothetical protein [Rhodospirillaceae bacterium]MDG2479837.1 hypothetical protein [Alphaproteobacteria bacterium]MBT6203791.1 hypothetical protein [Rhodospirillaceae bacterium]MBT6511351.1 hypothetical protein [Rhodospirillaceae bacterium]MBT7614512.1 hypothetical protein [Rhodospirillaceae bacterium]